MSSNNLCTPYYEPGSRITGRATGGAVTGKRFVSLAAVKDPASRGLDAGATGGNVRIKAAIADDPFLFGVAETDAADGKVTTVFTDGFVVPITAGTALAYGDYIKPGAASKVVKAADRATSCGMSLSDASIDQDAICILRF
jgi:hypothetical protein